MIHALDDLKFHKNSRGVSNIPEPRELENAIGGSKYRTLLSVKSLSSTGYYWNLTRAPILIRDSLAVVHSIEQAEEALGIPKINAIVLRGLAPVERDAELWKSMRQAARAVGSFKLDPIPSAVAKGLCQELNFESITNDGTIKSIANYLCTTAEVYSTLMKTNSVRARLLKMKASPTIHAHVDLFADKKTRFVQPWRLVIGFGVKGTGIILDEAIDRSKLKGTNGNDLRTTKTFHPEEKPPSAISPSWKNSCVTLGKFTPVLLKMEDKGKRIQSPGCVHFSPPSRNSRPIVVYDVA